ncbi:MAG TPA: mechanosensitive ion channel domain-containing protein [Nocardioidaceae bacterium]|nr:mechanosensitive ion channel domain-containing protein [Nocardioidaceae bacterium]
MIAEHFVRTPEAAVLDEGRVLEVVGGDRERGGYVVADALEPRELIGGESPAGAVVVGIVVGRLASRRVEDRYRKYYWRKIVHYTTVVVALIGLGIVWRPFAGQLGLLLGLVAAGLVIALQDVIGALAGWFNIISGGVFRVGDRVQVGGVRGDVIDIAPLRTKLMEIGSSVGDETWVRGRQYTGRIAAVSNRATFDQTVFNYSASFDFLWEEFTIPIAYRDDWRTAEQIINEEVHRISASREAEIAIAEMVKRYPVARTEVESRVFIRATDNYLELAARFVVPVRTARRATDEVTRRILDRLEEAGIAVSSSTQDITVRRAGPPVGQDDVAPADPAQP